MFELAIVLIVLHSKDGREIDINPESITQLHETADDDADNKYFTPGVRCMVALADGKFVTVVETCVEVRKLIKEREDG